MKFISKNSNYGVVLRHGMPAEPLTGRAAVPGLYARFSDGKFETNDEDMIKLLLNHVGFNSDYISGEEDKVDPYADNRSEMEPEHDLVDIKYGSVVGNKNPKPKLVLNREQKKLLEEIAQNRAIEILKEMVGKKNAENSEAPEDTDKVSTDVSETSSPSTSSKPAIDELEKVSSKTEEDDIKPILTKEETTKSDSETKQ